MFSWTVSKHMPRGIATSTDSVRAESITMSPFMTETTLVLKTSGGRMSWSRYVTVGTSVRGTALMIVTETMALKAFC